MNIAATHRIWITSPRIAVDLRRSSLADAMFILRHFCTPDEPILEIIPVGQSGKTYHLTGTDLSTLRPDDERRVTLTVEGRQRVDEIVAELEAAQFDGEKAKGVLDRLAPNDESVMWRRWAEGQITDDELKRNPRATDRVWMSDQEVMRVERELGS